MALDEFRKSVNAILYERVSSPLWGTLVFSWLAWNWQFIVVLFFSDPEKLGMDKLEYINENLVNVCFNAVLPFLSTLFLLTVFPFISEGAYRLHMYFRKRKDSIKEKYEGDVRLTVQQSIALRMELKKMQEQMKQLSEEKEAELEIVEEERDKAIEENIKKDTESSTPSSDLINDEENQKIETTLKNRELLKEFETVIEYVNGKKELDEYKLPEILIFSEKIDLISRNETPRKFFYRFKFTEKGEGFKKYYINKHLLK